MLSRRNVNAINIKKKSTCFNNESPSHPKRHVAIVISQKQFEIVLERQLTAYLLSNNNPGSGRYTPNPTILHVSPINPHPQRSTPSFHNKTIKHNHVARLPSYCTNSKISSCALDLNPSTTILISQSLLDTEPMQ